MEVKGNGEQWEVLGWCSEVVGLSLTIEYMDYCFSQPTHI